jgi:acetoacetate decarboxylase
MIRDVLERLAPFSALTPTSRRRVEAEARETVLQPGDTLVTERSGVSPLRVLVDGELEEWQRNRLIGVIEAPAVLGLAALTTAQPTDHTLRAATAVRVCTFSHALIAALDAEPAWTRATAAALSAEVMALRAARVDAVTTTDDFFDPPNARLVPGPYRFGPLRLVLHVVETARDALAALLPPGLHLLPGLGGRYLLGYGDFQNCISQHARADGRVFSYRETTPFIPCAGFGRVGAFIPELYPDSYMAILLGREIYGFPKRLGRTTVRDDGVDVIVDHTRLMRARWSRPAPLSPDDIVPMLSSWLLPTSGFGERIKRYLPEALSLAASLPFGLGKPRVFVRKQIVSEASLDPRRYRVDELIEVPVQPHPVTAAARFEAFDVRFSPQQRILRGEVRGVLELHGGLTFGLGHRLWNYRRWSLARSDA